MSASPLFRSAAPLASVGIVCLGLVPLLGGPDDALHWMMTAAMAGSGALLFVRHRLRGQEGALGHVEPVAARYAGRAVLIITLVITLLVGVIVGAQVAHDGVIAPMSLVMPAVGLAWLGAIGIRALRHREPPLEAAASETERPSRLPPEWKSRATGATPGRSSSDRPLSA